jgi:Holliday junction resolvase RusA-like endonuclease
VHQALVRQANEGRMRVSITISHARLYDADNAVGAIKPVLDALRKAGYIHDDSETWLELLPVRQERSAATAPAATIEIERAA